MKTRSVHALVALYATYAAAGCGDGSEQRSFIEECSRECGAVLELCSLECETDECVAECEGEFDACIEECRLIEC